MLEFNPFGLELEGLAVDEVCNRFLQTFSPYENRLRKGQLSTLQDSKAFTGIKYVC